MQKYSIQFVYARSWDFFCKIPFKIETFSEYFHSKTGLFLKIIIQLAADVRSGVQQS